ncbi:hypothetical protein L3N51_00547 [Metallosphaera sp. J1]|uniref:hypothetical protein n=1 Tax=Metallosphaera TaxID=41980 RepID=UPI001EDF2AC1|nr:hypothetical protein [Metallosphaera javensis (ex Hofmann et al. 2022)]MCG3108266.1 hypothetical protein [Metallosphaera javensis (ex Hofmann et al. 2022)]BCS93854.1 MAG: hypothetical protein MjAS7_2462 [Metallosphaera javensis (ex Sakai et al. 2022)]
MKVVKYELEGKIEINGKITTFKRKYRHLKFAKDYIRSLTGTEVKWSEDRDKILAEYKGQGISYQFEIRKNRIIKPKKEKQEKKEEKQTKEEKKEEKTEEKSSGQSQAGTTAS